MDANSRPDRAVVVGASAGGVEALRELAARFPADLRAPVLVVLHVSPTASNLPAILDRVGPLHAKHATDREPLQEGTILVAPPDHHLMIEDGHARVVRGPRENLHRPAVDPLFRSAALSFGPGTVAIVLSGTQSDGAAGAAAVSGRGGTVVVQDPDEAVYPDMPLSAIAADHPDWVLPLAEIPDAVAGLVNETRKEVSMNGSGPDDLNLENKYTMLDPEAIGQEEGIGRRAPFGCPDCGGVLWEVDVGGMLRFRCRVGHAYAADTLLEAQGDNLETALYVALRALEEKASLARRVRDRLLTGGNELSASRYDESIRESERHAKVIRAVLAGQSEAA
jgi:two-component system, chemotaxis family, protein-glutamate methylesterase/glutaminase